VKTEDRKVNGVYGSVNWLVFFQRNGRSDMSSCKTSIHVISHLYTEEPMRYPSRLLVTLIITKCLCGRVGFAQIDFRCCIQEFRDGAANLRESKDRQNVTPLYPALFTKFYTVVPGISDGLPCLNFVNCSICMMSSKLSKRCKTGILLHCQKMNTHINSHHM
jgi:hypothetical protein